MALINCPECGKSISNKAAACPHCGNPITQIQTEKQAPVKVKKFNVQKLFAVLLTLVSLVALVATKGTVIWGILFLAGLAWFIVLRILRD